MHALDNIPLFVEDYERILETLMNMEAEEAEKAMLAHIGRTKKIFLKSKRHKVPNR